MLPLLPVNSKIGDGIFILSREEIAKMDLPENETVLLKPYYDTTNIDRYYFDENNNFFIIYTSSKFKQAKSMNHYPVLKKHLDYYASVITSDNKPYGLHRARKQIFFDNPKIVSLRKCGTPTFSYLDKPAYVTAEWYCILTRKLNMKYLTCLLNSSLIKFWLLKQGKMQGNIFQIDKEPLENIPIALPSEKIEREVCQLYESIVSKKKNNKFCDTKNLERKIDEIIFEEYNIIDCERKIILDTLQKWDNSYKK